jgi:2-polyprenyl-3-methyl-5-hydroxy-6-metoxy-1,4-benzoquinol methylase
MSGVEPPVLGSEWPSDGLERVNRCPVCESSARSVLYDGLTDRTYRRAPGRWRMIRCGRCGSAYLDPRPSDETLHLAYRDCYDGPPSSPADSPHGWRRLRRALRNGYLNARYGYRLEPASRFGAFFVPLLPAYRQKADEYVRHLHQPSAGAQLLDVGCGEGDFLAAMQGMGWLVTGIEPSEEGAAIARAKGVPVEQTTLARASLADDSFDAVTIRLVFELLPDPSRALDVCRRALKPGGLLWVASPSLDSETHRIFRADWIFLDPPRHAVVYTPGSLSRLVERSGFEIVRLVPSQNAVWSFRMSAAIAGGLPPFDQPPRLPRRLAFRARLADLKAFRRPEVSDVVIVIARKR